MLTTLLLGLAALGATTTAPVHLRTIGSAFVGLGIVLYALAAIRAVSVLRPRDYGGGRVDDLRKLATDHWGGTSIEALRATYDAMVDMLGLAKSANAAKATDLHAAIWKEAIATGVLAFGALLTLLGW